MKYLIKLQNISKQFKDNKKNVNVLKDIDLEIYPEEFFVFVGPSGAGKSTILRIMSGLEKDYSGHIEFSPELKKQNMAFVFQEFALWPWLTVYKNIEIGLIANNMNPKQRAKRVNLELNRFKLEKFAYSKPKDLSGGMRQRVGLARAFAINPKIIFMDEPFSELDSFTAEELKLELLNIWMETKPTIIMVTHIVEDAVELGDRIAVLTPQPAKIEKIVINNLPRPRNKRSEDFFKLEDELHKLIRP
jgi:ABC-type nitrate/sulfonate/bicarbonate transport system ATPase subunit